MLITLVTSSDLYLKVSHIGFLALCSAWFWSDACTLMIPPCRARYLLRTVLCPVCSSNTPGSYLRMADLRKSHLPHWNNPSRAIKACDSIYMFLLAWVARIAISFAQVGRKQATNLGTGIDACSDSFDRESSWSWLHSPFALGLTVPFLACLLSDALGSAQGCSWTLKAVDYLWCKACMKPLRHLFL